METTNDYAEAGLLPFDPIVLIQNMAKRWLAVVLAALVLGVGAYIKTDLSYTPVYQTTTTFVVTSRGSSGTGRFSGAKASTARSPASTRSTTATMSS